MAIDPAVRARARELYCSDGLTYDQVSEQTGVPAGTIHRWARAEAWRQRRSRIQSDLSQIDRGTVRLRRLLVDRALETLEAGTVDPQVIYAVARMESVARKATEFINDDLVDTIQIRSPEDAVQALQDAIERQLNRFLAQPETLNLSSVKDLKKSLELVDELRARYVPTNDGQVKGLTDERADEIRRKILGIKQ